MVYPTWNSFPIRVLIRPRVHRWSLANPCASGPFRSSSFEPGPLLRAQPLPRHRALRPQRLSAAVLPGPVPPPHRTFRDPQVMRDLADRVAAGEPPGGLQPQPLTPLLLGGRVPAPLRIPHASVIRPRPHDVTTLSSTSSLVSADLQRPPANALVLDLPNPARSRALSGCLKGDPITPSPSVRNEVPEPSGQPIH